MQLDPREHFREIVGPAIADYDKAEVDLTTASKSGDPWLVRASGLRALRIGGSAVLFLHHFADVVAKRPPFGLPNFSDRVANVRDWLQANGAEDVPLLGDVADALKHAVLTQRLPREVEEAGQVIAVGRGYGTGRFGEGKFGGVEEVWVMGRSGPRPLSSVLHAVKDVWEAQLFR